MRRIRNVFFCLAVGFEFVFAFCAAAHYESTDDIRLPLIALAIIAVTIIAMIIMNIGEEDE